MRYILESSKRQTKRNDAMLLILPFLLNVEGESKKKNEEDTEQKYHQSVRRQTKEKKRKTLLHKYTAIKNYSYPN